MDILNLDINKYAGEIFIEWMHILDYWENHSVDSKFGGFFGSVDHENVPDIIADKGIILNSRILWSFSMSFKYLGLNEHKLLADKAYKYIINFFLDKEYGGVYWSVDYQGKPVSDRKQIYAQAFTIYALAEYYSITKNNEALKHAQTIFQYIEKNSFDVDKNGYLEALDRQWKPIDDVRLSDKDMNALKTMNTHLHVLEAYTTLFREWKDPALKKQLKNLICIFMDRIIDPETFHLNLFFDTDWKLLSTLTSYGHDIEASWLLYEAAEALEDKKLLKEIEPQVLNIAEAASEGVDKDGGLINELNYKTKHLDDDKHWWPQAEAMVGFLNAYQLSGESKYFELFKNSWEFTSGNIIDDKGGEWHWKVDKSGNPSRDEKIGFWKCPYHNSRACMEVLKRLKFIQ